MLIAMAQKGLKYRTEIYWPRHESDKRNQLPYTHRPSTCPTVQIKLLKWSKEVLPGIHIVLAF